MPRIITTDQLSAISTTFYRVLRERQITENRAEATERLNSSRARTKAERAMVQQLRNHPRLALLCLGKIPTREGYPQTTITTLDSQVVTL
jgi:hypothetical protein